MHPVLSPLMTHARFYLITGPPCRYARFASLAPEHGGRLHYLRPAHAVPLASTRQHLENQRKTRPAIRRSARWRVEEAHPGFSAGAEGPERARVGSRLPHEHAIIWIFRYVASRSGRRVFRRMLDSETYSSVRINCHVISDTRRHGLRRYLRSFGLLQCD